MNKRTAEEWGRIAVSLPGWRWIPGMLEQRTGERYEDGDGPWIVGKRPDPDDPATEGCMVRLLGDRLESVQMVESTGEPDYGWRVMWFSDRGRICSTPGFVSIGRACIAAAEALGRWPGGER